MSESLILFINPDYALTLAGALHIFILCLIRHSTAFDFDGLGGNTDFDVIRLNIFRGDGARADHRLFTDLRACEHGCVIGNARSVADARSEEHTSELQSQ